MYEDSSMVAYYVSTGRRVALNMTEGNTLLRNVGKYLAVEMAK